MTGNPVRWFEIYVQDMPRARKFYESVFDTRLERLDTPDIEIWAFPATQGASGCAGALVKMPGYPVSGNNTIVYFACEDCAVETSRVIEAGGRVEKDKFSIGQYGFIALVEDTEGNMIGMHSM
jgi:predicted enzyme related to lactoylglutathione lyase